MQKIKLHKKGPKLSKLIYGAWRLSEDKNGTDSDLILKKINTCLDIGITSFDHADIYGDYSCEEIFGNAIQKDKSISKKIEIISKCGIMLLSTKKIQTRLKYYDSSFHHIISSTEESLKKLHVEKIDLLLLHRPDPISNPEEIAKAFERLNTSGKVLHFGVSNYLPHQFETLQKYIDFPLSTNQIEINPLKVTPFLDGTLDQCLQYKIKPLAWSPFAGGRIFTDNDERTVAVRNVVQKIAEREKTNIESVILKWLTFSPHGILPIIGTNKIERILALKNFESIALDRQDWYEIYSASRGMEVE